jgi:hypothetical protein
MVSEYLSDEEQALDSFYDALLVEEENPAEAAFWPFPRAKLAPL